MTKNVTLAFDEEKLARLRVYAAQHRTTLNALFRKYADDLLEGDERRRKSRERLLELVDRNIVRDEERAAARLRGEDVAETDWRWNREDCYSGARFDRMSKP